MRPSRGDILDGKWLKDVEEVFVVAFHLLPGIVGDSRRFSDTATEFCGFCVIERTSWICLILKSSATQNFPLAMSSAYETIHQYM